MFVVGEAVIDEAIRRVSFRCDVKACKGACCTTEGGRGAPLADSEVDEINHALPVVAQYLSEQSLRLLQTAGPVEGEPGSYATPCIANRECAFVCFDEGGIARCAFEKAYCEGLTAWRKPLSCHLFPIRVRPGSNALYYEEIDECSPARILGRSEGVLLHDFLAEPLIRRYGGSWYEEFRHACKQQLDEDSA